MDELYELILDGLRNSGNFYDPEVHGTFESYLQSLQEPAIKLWESFRLDQVTVNYADPLIQAAYLIRYYPHYVEMALEVLRLLTSELSHKQEINACFFGSGPCPELVALVQFLKEHSSMSHIIDAKSYDIAANEWKVSRDITGKYIIPSIKPEWWQGNNSYLRGRTINLCSEHCFNEQEINRNLRESNLFIFQNCFNELENVENFQSNIKDFLEIASLDSLIIITDLLHNQNSNIISSVKDKSQEVGNFLVIQEGNLQIRSSLNLPSIITEHLLTGKLPPSKLIPRSRIRFVYLVLQKSEDIDLDLDEIPF